MNYEDVHRELMRAASGGRAHNLTIRVGILSRNSFRKFVASLRASGLRIYITEGKDWLDCTWNVDGEEKAIHAMREYCEG